MRRQANIRLARTVVLGTVAVALALLWMGDQYGIDRQETMEYMGSAALFVGALALIGVVAASALVWVRRATRDRGKSD